MKWAEAVRSVELPPQLLKNARICAANRGITLRELIEEALRERLARREDPMTPRTTPRRKEGMP